MRIFFIRSIYQCLSDQGGLQSAEAADIEFDSDQINCVWFDLFRKLHTHLKHDDINAVYNPLLFSHVNVFGGRVMKTFGRQKAVWEK
ncbi:unnamed protein product [Clonostachys byssicola]|uniref:Uncharacterized protein n=1 Tax=Clonostachys byssicola TaxID=160290 RepID=A0A9N9Y8Q5_9HYPO|nr:unnamed protein product [Clonostachys byssicola]